MVVSGRRDFERADLDAGGADWKGRSSASKGKRCQSRGRRADELAERRDACSASTQGERERLRRAPAAIARIDGSACATCRRAAPARGLDDAKRRRATATGVPV